VRISKDVPTIRKVGPNDLEEKTRSAIVRPCVEAHQEEDFHNLFSYLPLEGVHVIAFVGEQLGARCFDYPVVAAA
jgi:hypothetical protein